MNGLTRSEGIQIASEAAKRHGAPMCVVMVIEPGKEAINFRVDSWGCNKAVCEITGRLADELLSAAKEFIP